MNTKRKLFCKIADAMDAAARAKILENAGITSIYLLRLDVEFMIAVSKCFAM